MKAKVERALNLARKGRSKDALRLFEEDLSFTHDPTAMSYYAFCLAHIAGEHEKAVSLCIMAAEKEFYNPEIYFNLGRIFVLRGNRSFAIRAFRKGLKFDESHTEIRKELKKLGIRRRPVLPFFPRESFINRVLGMLASRISN